MTANDGNLPRGRLDAGTRDLDHYKRLLPSWRFIIRERVIPYIRRETPHLANLQRRCRTPSLDSYFAFTANMGTHTFFMIILPILFWCGQVRLGRAMTHILATGVFFSGFAKDMLCIPRPMSPPLQRITRSASAALEYGFPSTHSTNAVSVATYIIYLLNSPQTDMSPAWNTTLQVIAYFYASSIVFGRVYCGMHGFTDVIVGSLLGAGLTLLQCLFGDAFDEWIFHGPFRNIVIFTLIVFVLIRVHPEPADDCPCFDDSVAFSGTIIGIQLGAWHFARTGFAWDYPVPSTAPFSLHELGYVKTFLRIMVGVFVVFAWRGIMKPTLLNALPPIFRIIETLGLILPRRFHLSASKYKKVPTLRKDDNLIPPVHEIPSMLASLRNPRKRTVSVGAQSEADAHEAIAYREKRRRDSLTSDTERNSSAVTHRRSSSAGNGHAEKASSTSNTSNEVRFSTPGLPATQQTGLRGRWKPGHVEGDTKGEDILIVPSSNTETAEDHEIDRQTVITAEEDREIFRTLHVPRVRYDVEVITKLVVYTGIAWLAVEGNPILFELLGLGLGVRPS